MGAVEPNRRRLAARKFAEVGSSPCQPGMEDISALVIGHVAIEVQSTLCTAVA